MEACSNIVEVGLPYMYAQTKSTWTSKEKTNDAERSNMLGNSAPGGTAVKSRTGL